MPSATAPKLSANSATPALNGNDAAFGLYVHWPFCERKCPYCDFNSHVRMRVDAKAYEKALLQELGWFAARTGGRKLTSIFFGGGTPSLMPPETASTVIARACEAWRPSPDIEITLEANPGSAEARKFEAFANAGVNRLSIGVQSLRDDALRFLGRIHGAAEAIAAVRMAQDIFPCVSFDLIYARPGQTEAAWGEELGEALEMADGHLSLYQLTLEQDTAFYRKAARGEIVLPGEDAAAALYELTGKMCRKEGFEAYEVSNYARAGAECRHNLAVWQGGEYAGIGPGAHGRIRSGGEWLALSARRSPERWLAAVAGSGNGIEAARPLAMGERAEEVIMTAFRLREGLFRETFAETFGDDPLVFLDSEKWEGLKESGLVFETAERIGVNGKGILVLDAILGEVLA